MSEMPDPRPLLARVLNPRRYGTRRIVLQGLLSVALALLIVDRWAAYEFGVDPGDTAIRVVSSPRCPHSRAAKARLDELGIPYDEIDVDRDGLAAGLAGWHYQSLAVPIVVVGPEVIYGNRRERIEAALRRLGHEVPETTVPPEALREIETAADALRETS